MAYVKQQWSDGVSEYTPITSARMNHIEDGIADNTFETTPIDRGGTNASTAAQACKNLGALKALCGTAADLSYAALKALQPGAYLVSSSAANQPATGHGDGNLLVARNADNRVLAVVAYNSGAVYAAYGYETGGSAANFGWRRIDNAAVTLSSLGAAAASHNHAASAITSGTLPITRGGTGATTAAAARNALGLGNTSGAVPVANGGTGATTAANARTNLGISVSADTGSYAYRIKVGGVQVVCMYCHLGCVSASHTYSNNDVTIPWPFSLTPNAVASGSYFFNSENGKNVNVEASGIATNKVRVRTYGNPGYAVEDFVVTIVAMGPCA